MVVEVLLCARTVNHLLTKWKEHDLRKRCLFLIYTRVLACASSSPGKLGALRGTHIVPGVGNTFFEIRKGKGLHLTKDQDKASAGMLSPGGAPAGVGL